MKFYGIQLPSEKENNYGTSDKAEDEHPATDRPWAETFIGYNTVAKTEKNLRILK